MEPHLVFLLLLLLAVAVAVDMELLAEELVLQVVVVVDLRALLLVPVLVGTDTLGVLVQLLLKTVLYLVLAVVEQVESAVIRHLILAVMVVLV
jgi:hypothetical protein